MSFHGLIWGEYATFPYCILGMLLELGISLKCLDLYHSFVGCAIKSFLKSIHAYIFLFGLTILHDHLVYEELIIGVISHFFHPFYSKGKMFIYSMNFTIFTFSIGLIILFVLGRHVSDRYYFAFVASIYFGNKYVTTFVSQTDIFSGS